MDSVPRNVQKGYIIFTILIIGVAHTVVVLHTMALILRMQTLTVRMAQHGYYKDFPVMMVDMDVKPHYGQHVPDTQESAGKG